MIIVIDNYDSFTYNIVQNLSKLTNEPIKTLRSKECTIKDIESFKPTRLIISPGPGSPKSAGISNDAILYYAGKIPILGVCLGHQAIGYAFGANIINAKHIKHGIVEEIKLDGKGIFRLIGKKGIFTRYHSLVIEESSLSSDFEITATSSDGDIMGIRHKKYQIEGVQFHPESIASKNSDELFKAFLNYRKENLPTTIILNTLINKKDLTKESAMAFMEDLTDGFASEGASAAILTAIAAKGASASEIAGCAEVLVRKKQPIPLKENLELTDIVGTGGDEKGSFNISSMAAIVATSCNLAIAKHGNRAVSSKSGAADFYEALGIKIDNSPKKTAQIIEKTNFGFLFAPIYHSAMRHASSVRATLGIKTIMNLIGPLSNPANATFQMIGVYSPTLLDVVAEAAKILGAKRVMVVCSEDGFDEISPCARTFITEIREDNIKHSYSITPSDFGISGCTTDELQGGSAEHNAKIALEILNNPLENKHKTIKEAILLNAAATLYIGGKSRSLKEGYENAKNALETKKALAKLNEIKECANE
ncbi:bifunctional glutamine amidotransferase/anthranilate phosphoribosyltransferase [Helicobacter sp. 16-1353]|uniref:bifunctional anthranilate synthase component II/anthranilate phosphoribosyltransferase n=1 Tax=Helicobacter sp. 16-1353 TaxID=2004996 RepID=UPI000DCCDBBF|nr:bifunctional anthranilate synthase component II/anthranilate phosphoribosyltransferase [Helicobacter sp. 16-1353]RAX54941.1 bifunctional glutamine amidotransferase/anthranilate phosphoribosyltransferase [Helicobacter sp. 16-1353]